MHSIIMICLMVLLFGSVTPYSLVHNFDYTNWYSSFSFQALPDPTNGVVEYIDEPTAQSLGLTKIIGKQVYMSADNHSVLTGNQGRKSIWATSNIAFKYGLLIGDFAHMPGTDCGSWPSFWTISENGAYGEIDILESCNDSPINYVSLHTDQSCTFQTPSNLQLGSINESNTNCQLSNPSGCEISGLQGSYGTPFNQLGGGVYAMQWTPSFIKVWNFQRSKIPYDILNGIPDPNRWGTPVAYFDQKFGNCNIDSAFPPQTIYFDNTFCGDNAGGDGWSLWSGCPAKTGYATCEAYVRENPHAFDDAYWLINSVKVYQ